MPCEPFSPILFEVVGVVDKDLIVEGLGSK
jgi:hypothetical protein